jgi:hypothetical protein
MYSHATVSAFFFLAAASADCLSTVGMTSPTGTVGGWVSASTGALWVSPVVGAVVGGTEGSSPRQPLTVISRAAITATARTRQQILMTFFFISLSPRALRGRTKRDGHYAT